MCYFLFFLLLQASGYDPNRSKVSDNAMSDWLNGGIKMDIQSVPGIGPKAAQSLEKKGVTITQHLIAKYMSLATTEERENTDGEMEPMVDVYVTNQQFWHFLQDAGVNAARSGIVDAINRKVAQMDPAFVDNNDYAEEE